MQTDFFKPLKRGSLVQRGFTLIEVMIVVAIIGILSAIALPAYNDYVLRGQITEATTTLASIRASMEQFYQDNRTYDDTGTTLVSPCNTKSLAAIPMKYFTLTCTGVTQNTYTITATGNSKGQPDSKFTYSITSANVQSSTVGVRWGSATGATCWITKKGSTC
ncbi:type IV pilin protein [Undibacterium sp. Dicai25W]|uniref:type IV pilin protein n=1 Tax=Undibacterium sp. Dicai25W TaxID=3413034 RepID=UPI003BF23CF9